MNPPKQNNSGFSAIIVVITIIIVGLIGAIGWLAYQNYLKPQPVTTTAASTPTKTVPTDPTAGWKTYTTPDGVSFQYPPNWTFDSQNSSFLLNSPVDSSSNLQFSFGYTKYTSPPSYWSNDTVLSSLPLGAKAAKPLYMLTLDFKNSSGSDVDGLYVTDENATTGANVASSTGFTPSKGVGSISFYAILEPPNAQNNPGQKLATYQNNPNYQTVINIFKSIR